jgi:alpha-tubulin suppressor-like RCC1 family protein
LGDGTTTDQLTLVTVSGLGSSVLALAAGINHTCALISGGAVQCWGRNDRGL